MSSLRVAETERAGPDLLPKQLEAAWDAFADSVPEDVAAEVLSAVRDPAPLAGALERAGPRTLLPGDLRDDNLGLADYRFVLLDWDLLCCGPPAWPCGGQDCATRGRSRRTARTSRRRPRGARPRRN